MDNIEMKNLYQILGVSKTATQQEIKKSYRRLALKYHPDKNKSLNATEKFNHIKVAYDILSNDENRIKYDSLNNNEHDNLLNILYNFIGVLINKVNLNNINTNEKSSNPVENISSILDPMHLNKLINVICNNDSNIINDCSYDIYNGPNYDDLKKQIEVRLKDKINIEYINNFMKTLLEDKNKLHNVNLDANAVDLSVFFSPEEVEEAKADKQADKQVDIVDVVRNHTNVSTKLRNEEDIILSKKDNINISNKTIRKHKLPEKIYNFVITINYANIIA